MGSSPPTHLLPTTHMRYLFLFATFALCPSLAFAQQDAKTPDPDPELERKTFTVAPGFEVTLFAADPLLAKPIQMNFDPQGAAVGRVERDLPADQTGREGQRQDHHPRRHQGRRQSG